MISTTPENWEDANFYAIGASYQIDDQWKLRLGLAYDEAAVLKEAGFSEVLYCTVGVEGTLLLIAKK